MNKPNRHLVVLALPLVVFLTITNAEKLRYVRKVQVYRPPLIANTLNERPAKVVSYSKKTIIPVEVPSYEFGYRVHDPIHENYQEKTEIRKGDEVQGFYSFLQPNGVIQVVSYRSDDGGFRSKISLHKSRRFKRG